MVESGIFLRVAVGKSCKDTDWRSWVVSWEDFVQRCRAVVRTPETLQEYLAMTKAQQGKIKDVGGFVGGELSDGHRMASHVLNRYLLAYDLDDATPEYVAKLQELVPYQGLFYSTHKHRPEKPRIRLVLPVTRPLNSDEFVAVSRLVAYELGILEMVDVCSFQPHQMMYWPTAAKDGEFLFGVIEKPWLNPDEVLARYPAWQDFSTLPRLPSEKVIKRLNHGKAMNPLKKYGIPGAFNRVYDIHGAIERFLAEVYLPTANEDRYTYSKGECAAGLVVYDHGNYAYSHHQHDPVCGRLCDAFDLVRLHLYGQLGEKKSKDAMKDMAKELPEIKQELQCFQAERQKNYDTTLDLGGMAQPPSKEIAADLAQPAAAIAETIATDLAQPAVVGHPTPAGMILSTAGTGMTQSTGQDWTQALEYDRQGGVKKSLENLLLILSHEEMLRGIKFNEMSGFIEVEKDKLAWEHPGRWWRDADDAQLLAYLSQKYTLFGKRIYEIGLAKIVDDRRFHPVLDYLAALPPWDGISRVETLLIDYLGAEDNTYVRAVTRKILCAAVYRVRQPGCKFDNMLVLNGPQGEGKSTLISKLGGPWFNDSLNLNDTKDKTAAEKMQGYWILEIGELAGLGKAKVDSLRSFLSSQCDVFRASFGRHALAHPRQCIFIGTTNAENGYLRDTAGNRRFWPVQVRGHGRKRSWDMTEEDVQQIWAEACMLVDKGEKLYLTEDENVLAKKEQRKALETDAREGLIAKFLTRKLPKDWGQYSLVKRLEYLRHENAPEGTETRQEVCTYELWCECLGCSQSALPRKESYQLIAILQKLGWEKKEKRHHPIYGPQNIYVPLECD